MQYNLTEEQSTKFYEDVKNAVETIDRVHKLSVQTFKGWYDDYYNNHHSFFGFKPMSIEKFGKKITCYRGIHIKDHYDHRQTISNSGWTALLKVKKISKLTHREYSELYPGINLVTAACMADLSASSEYNVWKDILHKMENFMKVPYTVDEKWLSLLEKLPTTLYYYSYMLGDDTK